MTEQRIREILDRLNIKCSPEEFLLFNYAELIRLVEYVYTSGYKNGQSKQ